MKLGTYVEVRAAAANIASAQAAFEKLGLKKIADTVFTDGGLNIGLQTDALAGPTLAYSGSNLDDIRAAGIAVNGDTITSPEGVHLLLSKQVAPAPMPEGDIMSRKPISRMGKFGEYAIPTQNFDTSVAFWKALGFEQLHAASEPYPWGIFSDGLIVVGLHQPDPASGQPMFYEPHITYFSGDMADRIAALKQDGFAISDVLPEYEGRVVNASMTGPGDLRIFLFHGEI